MRVHYLQHVSFEGLGFIETWLNEHNHSITGTHFFQEQWQWPSFDSFDALIIMGGPMGVYDEVQYPWLQAEKSLIRTAIELGKKVLGICLGAQLIADSLGMPIKEAPNKEIGWFPVTPTSESPEISWFHSFFRNRPMVFHWHGDQFHIPGGAYNLLSSEANQNQAFIFHKHTLGLQFHLEVTPTTLKQMLENAGNELTRAPYVQSLTDIHKLSTHIKSNNKILSGLLQHWLYDR
ncbi:type 1 glutamine amidotransferase [Fulvivirgaceae bacterium BMA12]|uniref:Type 1 glutamine amidotransferase n=1 Tax=Agaribacillus aureus TaxID=3051825 RepID=A0ABT8L2F9_9BACT|nr:type 1 glutamine amidotransferase [Fulvivirgaceae bacterium BMA12]